MAGRDPITIDGLGVFVRNLKVIDAELPKALRVGLNAAADLIVDYARPRIPTRSGRAARSLRARSTGTAVRVSAGGARAPYYPWLDFGGRVGRNRSVQRAFLKDGRYIYEGYRRRRPQVVEVLEAALIDAARRAGVQVD